MFKVIVAALILVFAIAIPVSTIAQTTNVERSQPAAQQTNEPDLRARAWARFDAMKRRWQQDRLKFDACAEKLKDAKKHKRMSVYRQIDFMEDCMQTKG
jgi:hypothetical protein